MNKEIAELLYFCVIAADGGGDLPDDACLALNGGGQVWRPVDHGGLQPARAPACDVPRLT